MKRLEKLTILYVEDDLELQKETNISLHKDNIIFPAQLFSANSEISKHQNLIKYIDFLGHQIFLRCMEG